MTHTDEQAAATLNTSAVAQLLEITEQAVPLKMSRAGIEPVGRQVGRGGKNLYPRAAVLALTRFTPATVVRSSYHVAYEVAVNLATPVEWEYLPGAKMRVEMLVMAYQNSDPVTPKWEAIVTLHGPRLRKNLTAGADTHQTLWRMNGEQSWAPDFVRPHLAQHAPEGYDPS